VCSPIRQFIISNEKGAKAGLRVCNVRTSGPRSIGPYVELVFVAVVPAGGLGMH